MNKKYFVIYAVALLLLPVLLLLVVRFKSPSEIMYPPGTYGDNQKVQKAFESSVNKKDGITLKYPMSGENRTAFVSYDIDNDDTDEVIVFYILNSDETTVRVNILDYINDQWESVYDVAGYGSEIYSIDFVDLNNDETPEIICCWSLYDSNASKVMTIHSTEGGKGRPVELKTLVNQTYSFMGVTDMDSDGKNEVLTIASDTKGKVQKSTATLLKMINKDTIAPIGPGVALDASVSSYTTLKMEFSNDKAVAFVDAYKGEDTMITEVLWWDPEKQSLVAPFLDAETLTNTVTLRSPAIPSMDIDSDGEIEIPVNLQNTALTNQSGSANPNAENEELSTQIHVTKWISMTPTGIQTKSSSFINDTAGYMFNIPANRTGTLLAYQTDSGVVTIYSTPDGVTREDPLFSLVTKEKSKLTNKDAYTFKKENDDYLVYGTLTSAGEALGFTNQEIVKQIVFFEKGV